VRPRRYLKERLLAALPTSLSDRFHVSLIDAPRPTGRAPLRVIDDEVRGGLIILLDHQHHLTALAYRDPRSTSAELLLIEMARRLSVWAHDRDVELNLLEMQRVLIAQRMAAPSRDSREPTRRPTSVPISEN